MKVSQLREVTGALAKFATVRETSSGPESLVGVQIVGGQGRFIAGNSRAGIVVDASIESDRKDHRFTILARPLLQAAKALPARSGVELGVSEGRLIIRADGGGTVDIDAVGTIKDAGFAKKPKGPFRAEGTIPGPENKRIANLFKHISAKVMVPTVQHVDSVGYATAFSTSGAEYACLSFSASGDAEYSMAAYLDFWEGLGAIEDDSTLRWGRSGVIAVSGSVEVFSEPYLVSKYDAKKGRSEPPREQDPWPILQISGELENGFTVDRKKLLEVIKGQAPFDEHNRITLQVNTDSIRVIPFGTEAGMDYPAEAFGRGIRSVRADYLTGLLSKMDTKEVTLRWGSGTPAVSISAQDYENWTILLAPVTL